MPTIADVADQIAEKFDVDRDAALTLATTYAAQLDYDAAEGGQYPNLEVSDEDAQVILESAAAAYADDAPAVLDDITAIAIQIPQLEADRDSLIRRAIADGVRVQDIAEAAGLSRARVYQIRDRTR